MLDQRKAVLRQYAAAISAALCAFIVGNWVAWPATAVGPLLSGQTRLNVTRSQISLAVALLDLGNALSAVPASFLTNWLGRRLPLVALSGLLLSTWVLAILASHVYYLYAARLIAGVCKGVAFTVAPIYLGEIAGVKVRGGVGGMFCGMMNYGLLFGLCLGTLLSYDTLNVVLSPFPIAFFLLFFWFPESPYYLVMKDRLSEARSSLAWFRSLKEDSVDLEKELLSISKSVKDDLKMNSRFTDLVRSAAMRRAMLISMGLALFQRLSGMSAIIAYSPVTLPPTGGYFKPEVYMIIFGATTIVGQSISMPLLDSVGRKPLLMVSCFGCACSTGISTAFYWLSVYMDTSQYNWVPYFCVVLYGVMFAIGLGIIPSVIVVELFPSNLRSYATCMAAIFFALGSFIVNESFLHVKSAFGVHYMYLFFTVISTLSIVFIHILCFETSGKSFSEIQRILNKKQLNRTVSNLPLFDIPKEP